MPLLSASTRPKRRVTGRLRLQGGGLVGGRTSRHGYRAERLRRKSCRNQPQGNRVNEERPGALPLEPHQRALPSGLPPRAEPLGTLHLERLDGRGHKLPLSSDPSVWRQRQFMPPPCPTAPNGWIAKALPLLGGPGGQSPPGGFQGRALALLRSSDCLATRLTDQPGPNRGHHAVGRKPQHHPRADPRHGLHCQGTAMRLHQPPCQRQPQSEAAAFRLPGWCRAIGRAQAGALVLDNQWRGRCPADSSPISIQSPAREWRAALPSTRCSTCDSARRSTSSVQPASPGSSATARCAGAKRRGNRGDRVPHREFQRNLRQAQSVRRRGRGNLVLQIVGQPHQFTQGGGQAGLHRRLGAARRAVFDMPLQGHRGVSQVRGPHPGQAAGGGFGGERPIALIHCRAPDAAAPQPGEQIACGEASGAEQDCRGEAHTAEYTAGVGNNRLRQATSTVKRERFTRQQPPCARGPAGCAASA